MSTFSSPESQAGDSAQRQRPFTALSNNSKRSRRSSSFSGKMDLTETHKEKARLHTKADPSAALNEAQPVTVALEESNLEDLRAMVHRDASGNVITDPDLSNPTRPRMERPLETIMSFHRAADSTRKLPTSPGPGSQIGPVSPDARAEGNRRSSYYGNSIGGYGPQPRNRPPGSGYYSRNSSYSFRPDSYYDNAPGHGQYQSNRGMRGPGAAPYGVNGEGMSPTHSQQMSYDTMTSGSDENNKTTNPSSVNSSFDQIHSFRKPEEAKHEGPWPASYGANANNPTNPSYGLPTPFSQNGTPAYGSAAPLSHSLKDPRGPIKLNSTPISAAELEAERAKINPPKEKRKSWLRRRFSRRES